MKKNSKALNLAIWLVIALFTILTLIATIWAAHQPHVGSMWAPE